MSIKSPVACLCVLILFTRTGLAQQESQKIDGRPQGQVSPAASTKDPVPEALRRIDSELKQLVVEVKDTDARMMRDSSRGGESLSARIHELLRKENLEAAVGDFLMTSQDQVRWESCLSAGKLYRALADEVVATNGS